MVSQVLYGEVVTILDSDAGYRFVRCADGYEGWVHTDAVVPSDPSWLTDLVRYRVSSLLEPVYGDPKGSRQQTLLTIGTEVRLAREKSLQGGFVEIVHPDGTPGWIRAAALEPLPTSGMPDTYELVLTACRFLGVPYLWGGRSPFGIDCSGFTQRVYALHGVVLPRDAYQQAAWDGLQPVAVEELEAGDLLFYGGEDPRGRGIVHVGMALDRHRLIHAAGSTGVTLSDTRTETRLRTHLKLCGRVAPTRRSA